MILLKQKSFGSEKSERTIFQRTVEHDVSRWIVVYVLLSIGIVVQAALELGLVMYNIRLACLIFNS
jgi:hypothetical protein